MTPKERSLCFRESNLALPGEWLFPLQSGPISVDAAHQSRIRTATEDFLDTIQLFCEPPTTEEQISVASNLRSDPDIVTHVVTDSASAQVKPAYDENPGANCFFVFLAG